MPFSLELLLNALATITSLSLIIYSIVKGKKGPLLYSFIFFQVIILIWSLRDYILKSTFLYDTLKLDFLFLDGINKQMFFFCMSFTGLSGLLFTLYITNSSITKNKKIMTLIFALPIIFYIGGMLTNFYGLFSSRTFARYVYMWLSYVYTAFALIILLMRSINNKGQIRTQSILLFIAIGLPRAIRVVADYNVFITYLWTAERNVDILPAVYTITTFIIALATFRYRMLDIMPVAMNDLFDKLSQAIVVTDVSNEIVHYNRSFEESFSKFHINNKKYTSAKLFASELTGVLKDTNNNKEIIDAIKSANTLNYNGEMVLEKPRERFFSVSIKPIIINSKEIVGRIITLNDITTYKNLLNENNRKNIELQRVNEELSLMNEQLKQSALTVEELAVEKERNRIARDVHDTLGHTMAVLITLLNVSSITCRNDPEKTHEQLKEATAIAKEGLKELRRSISGIKNERLEQNSLIDSLKDMIKQYEVSGIKVELIIEGVSRDCEIENKDTIFRLCQEALTNSLRHGKAKHSTIILKLTEGHLKVLITDDGIGCTEIQKGYGLTGMEQRITDACGTVRFGSDGEKGFNIYAEIPAESSILEGI